MAAIAISVITINAYGLNDDASRNNFSNYYGIITRLIQCASKKGTLLAGELPGPGPVEELHWGTSYWNPGPSSRSEGGGRNTSCECE